MRASRLLSLFALMSVSGCAARYKTELVGHGTVGSGIELPAGTYDLALWFDVPRAQQIEWTVTCPGVQLGGTAGEPFADYRARRIAELRLQRQRDRERASAVTSTLVGAVAPSVGAHASTRSGPVAVQAGASVDADLAGDAVAHAVIDDVIELPPGDVGAGRLASRARIDTTGAGVCAITAISDDATVIGSYRVSRVRDLRAEARERAKAQAEVASATRMRVQTRLVTRGADPMARQRQLEAEQAQARVQIQAQAEADARIRARVDARAHAEAQLRLQAQAEANARAEVRRRAQAELEARAHAEAQLRLRAQADARARLDGFALSARAELRGRYVRRGADAGLRARLEAQREAQREVERRRRMQITAQVEAQREAARAARRIKAEADMRAVIDVQQQRLDRAERARMALRARFVAWGAIPRPPMPALLAEHPGDPPFAGARWVAGTWAWIAGRWQWRPGGWTDPDVFTETGGDVMVDIGGEAGGDLGVGFDIPVRDHRGPAIRDHRSSDDSSTIRDHRSERTETKPEPTVRDHRSSRDEIPTSTIRDHRDDKKDDKSDNDDRRGTVRDHRR